MLCRFMPPAGTARVLTLVTLVQSAGLGLVITLSAIYFIKFVGLSVGQVGFALTFAGCLGLLVGVPAGHLADLVGARGLLVILMMAGAVAIVGYSFVSSFTSFLAVVSAYQVASQAASAVRGGLPRTPCLRRSGPRPAPTCASRPMLGSPSAPCSQAWH